MNPTNVCFLTVGLHPSSVLLTQEGCPHITYFMWIGVMIQLLQHSGKGRQHKCKRQQNVLKHLFFSQGGVAWCTADGGKPTGRGLVAVLNVLGEINMWRPGWTWEGINLGAIRVVFSQYWGLLEVLQNSSRWPWVFGVLSMPDRQHWMTENYLCTICSDTWNKGRLKV